MPSTQASGNLQRIDQQHCHGACAHSAWPDCSRHWRDVAAHQVSWRQSKPKRLKALKAERKLRKRVLITLAYKRAARYGIYRDFIQG